MLRPVTIDPALAWKVNPDSMTSAMRARGVEDPKQWDCPCGFCDNYALFGAAIKSAAPPGVRSIPLPGSHAPPIGALCVWFVMSLTIVEGTELVMACFDRLDELDRIAENWPSDDRYVAAVWFAAGLRDALAKALEEATVA